MSSRLRTLWDEGKTAYGLWLLASTPSLAELIGSLGFDYVCIDCQHGLLAYEQMRDILIALNGMDTTPIVRVPSNDAWWIGKALDAGAQGIVVPLVNSKADAERAAAACRYPPDGDRSFGLVRTAQPLGRTPAEINSGVLCLPMIETREGLDAADDICAVAGVDGIYIGPADLALSLGSPSADEHKQATERVRTACLDARIVPGIHALNGSDAKARVEQGFRMVTVTADASSLAGGALAELRAAKS